MNILLIEDDEIKAENILNFLNKEQKNQSKLFWKKSWQGGLIEILDNNIYDIILLDMSMPRYDSEICDSNEEFETFAGRELMKEMKRKKIFTPVCVVTAFDIFGKDEYKLNAEELNVELTNEFKNFYLGMISFSTSLVNWKDELLQVIERVKQ